MSEIRQKIEQIDSERKAILDESRKLRDGKEEEAYSAYLRHKGKSGRHSWVGSPAYRAVQQELAPLAEAAHLQAEEHRKEEYASLCEALQEECRQIPSMGSGHKSRQERRDEADNNSWSAGYSYD